MLKIENIKLPPGAGMAELTAEAARLLRVKEFVSLRVLRRSIDARDGVQLVYTVEAIVKDEAAVLRRCRSRKVSRMERPKLYALPDPISPPEIPPVVVGAGPGGLFAALVLAQAGLRPILLERGRPVEQRRADVERFWSGGGLDETSNVQFGEGGAGRVFRRQALHRHPGPPPPLHSGNSRYPAARRRISSLTPSPM